jgi:peptidoglycan/LPS O-acetylase OafA/YrhL
MVEKKDHQRMYYLDWLRIFGIVTIVFFHIFCIFSKAPWIINNNEPSIPIHYLLGFLVLWIMPLFFTISGYAMYYSLTYKGQKGFIKDKFKRLIIPYIFGVFFIAPIVVYIERIFNGDYSGTYLEFYSNSYYQGLYGFGGNFAWMGMHLWFLFFLFIFIVIGYYPAIYFLKERKKPVFDNITKYLEKRGMIFLMVIPIILIFYLSRLEPVLLGREIGRWSIMVYSPFFFYGFLFAYDERYGNAIENNWKIAVILAILTTSTYFCVIFSNQFLSDYYNPVILIPAIVSSFSMLIALIGVFRKYFNKKYHNMKKLNEAVLPVYILHIPVIVIVGYFIVRMELLLIFKLFLIIITSFIMISALYLLIRKFNIFRILFGMKTQK